MYKRQSRRDGCEHVGQIKGDEVQVDSGSALVELLDDGVGLLDSTASGKPPGILAATCSSDAVSVPLPGRNVPPACRR